MNNYSSELDSVAIQDINTKPDGLYTLALVYPLNMSVAAPLVPKIIEGLTKQDFGAPSAKRTEEIVCFGVGNDNSVEKKINPTWSGNLVFNEGAGVRDLNTILGIAAANKATSWWIDDQYPHCDMVFIRRDVNNTDVLFYDVIEEMHLGSPGKGIQIGSSDLTIPFYTKRRPWSLPADDLAAVNNRVCIDKFTMNGSANSVTLTQTPIQLVPSNQELWNYQKMASVRHQASGALSCKQLTDGELVTKTITFDAIPPAGTISVIYGYVKV